MLEHIKFFDYMNLDNYNEIKEFLVIKAINLEANKKLLDGIPYKVIGDIAIIYQIIGEDIIDKDKKELGFIVVSNEMLIDYGIDLDTLHNDAIKSSENIFPPKINESIMLNGVKQFSISNIFEFNGANSIFYSDVLKNIADKEECNLIIIPCSTYSCLAYYDFGFSYGTMKDMELQLKLQNEESDLGDMKLSNHIYHYDVKEKILETCDEYEARMQLNKVYSRKCIDQLTKHEFRVEVLNDVDKDYKS